MAFASETRFHLTIALWMVAHAPNQVAKGQRLVRSSGQTAMAPIPSKEVVVGPRGSPENSPQPFHRAVVVREKHLPEGVREREVSTDPEREPYQVPFEESRSSQKIRPDDGDLRDEVPHLTQTLVTIEGVKRELTLPWQEGRFQSRRLRMICLAEFQVPQLPCSKPRQPRALTQ